MSERIFTLFGEEIIPEQQKAVGRSRAKKKAEEKNDAPEEEQPEEGNAQVASAPQETAPSQEPEVEITVETEGVLAEAQMLPVQEAVVAPTEETELPKKKERKPKAEKKEAPKPENLPEDWRGNKQYFSIGEVAELFKVKTSHIRFWTNEFKLNVRTTRKGDRLYTTDQIREIRAIHHLVKERGFTLTGAKAKLKAQNNMDVETVDLKQSLLQLRNKLMAIKNQLK